MSDIPSFEDQRTVRMEEAIKMIGLSRSTIYAMAAAGTIPPPTRIGKRAVGWPQHELLEYLRGLAKRRAERAHSSQL